MQEDQSQILSRLARLEARQKPRPLGVLALLLLGALALVGIAGEEEDPAGGVEPLVLRDANGRVRFKVEMLYGTVQMTLRSDDESVLLSASAGPGKFGPLLTMVGNPRFIMRQPRKETSSLKVSIEDRTGGNLVLEGKSGKSRGRVSFNDRGAYVQLIDPDTEHAFLYQGDERSAAGRLRVARAYCRSYQQAVLLIRPVKALSELEQTFGTRKPFRSLVTDPWGGEFWVETRDGVPTVVSNGPDGLPNTQDDISHPPR